MYWIDNNTGISTAPTPPAVISITKKFFTNGGGGEQPSIPEDFWFNMIQEELLGVLTMAGITPAKNDLGQVAKAIQSIAFSAYPVGAPIPWPTAVPPPGFIAMTGQSFSAAAYPKLALAYPSLTLPNMQAEFIRGYDASRGIDPGRTILTSQLDALQNILGEFSCSAWRDGTVTATGALYSSGVTATGTSPDSLSNKSQKINFDASRSARTSTETRPRNIPFLYIVRAA